MLKEIPEIWLVEVHFNSWLVFSGFAHIENICSFTELKNV